MVSNTDKVKLVHLSKGQTFIISDKPEDVYIKTDEPSVNINNSWQVVRLSDGLLDDFSTDREITPVQPKGGTVLFEKGV